MTLKKLTVAAIAIVALAASGLAAAADPPRLEIGPPVVKVSKGKLVLLAKCIGETKCQSVLTARIDVRNGGLGGQIFKVEPGQTAKLTYVLEPNVRRWLKTHRRSRLVISARTSDENYEVVWRGTFRLTLLAY